MFIRRSVASLFFALALSAVSASASTISAVPVSPTYNVGEVVTVNIDIATVVDLYTFQFSLAFDPTILEFQSMVEGPFLQSGGSTFFDQGTISPGTVSFVFNTLVGDVPGVSDGGTLAIATFVALMATGMTPTSIVLSDALLLDSSLGLLDLDAVNSGSVQVNAPTSNVPEDPSPIVLLAAGLALVAFRGVARVS